MRKEKTGKERFNELRYQMEKNSFVLNVLESRTAAVLHAESMGYSDTETAMISRISTEYVKLIRAVKNQHPGSIEDIAQELYDRIYMQTGWKRDYSRFQLFDEELIEKWFVVKEQERQLRAGNIDLDDFVSTVKHAYWSKTGKDVDVIVKEVEQKSEQLEQQEVESEEELTDEERLNEFREQMTREEVLSRMYKEGAIDEDTARKYMKAEELSTEAFSKIIEMHTGETEPEMEPKTDEEPFDFCEYHMKETEAKLLCRMYKDGVINEDTALEYIDEPSLSHEDFLRIVDVYTEENEGEVDE